jgi:threonine dehydrogenase-like Zn-dependent dehydrogenase
MRVSGPVAGRRVLILGAGMLGITAAAYSKAEGAASVTISDVLPRRLERAAHFGADHLVPWSAEAADFRRCLSQGSGNEEFDVVLELSGSPAAVESAIQAGDVGARIVLVGSVMASRLVPVDPERVVRRWLTIQGVHNYSPTDLHAAVAFLERCGRTYPFAGLVESSFPLSEVNAAIDHSLRNRPVRVAVKPEMT